MARIGIITTPDHCNDREFWRWTPEDTTLIFTRTPLDTLGDPGGGTWTPSDEELIQGTRAFVTVRPEVTMFACTSGSFGKGLANERRIRSIMERAGAQKAMTTSGSVLDALHALGARRVAVATPYGEATTALLGRFLSEAGFEVLSLVARQPRHPGGLSDMTIDELSEAARAADRPDADVVFVSCAALATYDLIGLLERSLGKPVISSSQATVWAALGAAGVEPPTGIDQTLFRYPWAVSPARAA